MWTNFVIDISIFTNLLQRIKYPLSPYQTLIQKRAVLVVYSTTTTRRWDFLLLVFPASRSLYRLWCFNWFYGWRTIWSVDVRRVSKDAGSPIRSRLEVDTYSVFAPRELFTLSWCPGHSIVRGVVATSKYGDCWILGAIFVGDVIMFNWPCSYRESLLWERQLLWRKFAGNIRWSVSQWVSEWWCYFQWSVTQWVSEWWCYLIYNHVIMLQTRSRYHLLI